jgi:hypothetical protein
VDGDWNKFEVFSPEKTDRSRKAGAYAGERDDSCEWESESQFINCAC